MEAKDIKKFKKEIEQIKSAISKAIRNYRESSGYTYNDMCERLDITKKAYYNIEHGKLKLEKQYKYLLKILDVPEHLYEIENKTNPFKKGSKIDVT